MLNEIYHQIQDRYPVARVLVYPVLYPNLIQNDENEEEEGEEEERVIVPSCRARVEEEEKEVEKEVGEMVVEPSVIVGRSYRIHHTLVNTKRSMMIDQVKTIPIPITPNPPKKRPKLTTSFQTPFKPLSRQVVLEAPRLSSAHYFTPMPKVTAKEDGEEEEMSGVDYPNQTRERPTLFHRFKVPSFISPPITSHIIKTPKMNQKKKEEENEPPSSPTISNSTLPFESRSIKPLPLAKSIKLTPQDPSVYHQLKKVNPSIEVSRLERRVRVLLLAKKYQLEDAPVALNDGDDDEEEDENDGRGSRLERLAEGWKGVGR